MSEPCSSQNFPNDKTAGVSSQTFIVKNISNYLTQTVASSCVCTSPLAVVNRRWTSRCRHGFQFSGIQVLFADHVHRRSGVYNKVSFLKFKIWWRRQTPTFPRWEECCFIFSLNLRIFLASLHAASRVHRSCHSVSSWNRSSNFWSVGSALMRFTWANHSKRWILVSNVSMAYEGFCEFYTSDWFPYVWALPQNRWLRRLHILKYAIQLSCNFPQNHCTFVTILFRSFARLFFSLAMRMRTLCIHSPTCRTCILEDAIFHRMNWCKFLWGNPCKQSRHSSTWDSFLWDFWFSMHFLFLPRRKVRRRIGLCRFCTLVHIVLTFHTLPRNRSRRRNSAVLILHTYLYRVGNCNCLLSNNAR